MRPLSRQLHVYSTASLDLVLVARVFPPAYAEAMKNDSALIWLVMVAGLTLGILLSVIGLIVLDGVGPVPLIIGLVFLAFGGAAFFNRQRA